MAQIENRLKKLEQANKEKWIEVYRVFLETLLDVERRHYLKAWQLSEEDAFNYSVNINETVLDWQIEKKFVQAVKQVFGHVPGDYARSMRDVEETYLLQTPPELTMEERVNRLAEIFEKKAAGLPTGLTAEQEARIEEILEDARKRMAEYEKLNHQN